MKDESAPPERLRHHEPGGSVPRGAARLTGIQASHGGAIAQFEGWRQQMGPNEWRTLVDLMTRWFAAEQSRLDGLTRAA